MSMQQIVAIALRLFAIWLLVIALQIAAVAVAASKSFGGGSPLVVYVLPVLPLLLAVFLWRFPMFTARRLLPHGTETATPRIAPRDAIIAGTAIIGLWALVGAIPHLLGTISLLIAAGPERLGLAPWTFYLGPKVDLLATIAQCLLGLFLIAKPRSIARLVFRGAPGEGEQSAAA